ncbi:MAG TPA: alpha/beta hydrolase [Acidimicrobiales bacterium]|nr:alpha/beta hydrolase [Acidimicrobiales bacterium]
MTGRRFALAAAAAGSTGLLAGVVVQRRDARAVAADPTRAELTEPLTGRPIAVVSDDGTVLHAEVHGLDDGVPLMLVHGWMCTSAVWRYQIRALSARCRVVTYDQRGHGRSSPAVSGDYSSDTLAADLDAVLHQAVPAGEPAAVAGHSMGAMAVVAWASTHRHEVSDRLAAVALVNVGVEDLIGRSTIIPFPAALTALRSTIGERVLASPLPVPASTNPLLTRLVRAVALGPAASPAQVAFCTELFLETPTDVRAAFGATLSTFDLARGLPALSVPTVVLAGEHDRLTPPVHGSAIKAEVPGATLVEMAGVGHMAPIEAHREVTDHLRRLVGERGH